MNRFLKSAFSIFLIIIFVLSPVRGWSHQGEDAHEDSGEGVLLGGLLRQGSRYSSPDAHGPIGVMGEHTHKQGEMMFSYRFMYMDMDGNRDGHSRKSLRSVLLEFPVAPFEMQTLMHMPGAMYAVNESLTLMLMVPFVQKWMDHKTRMGGRFATRAEGLGDIKLSGLWKLLKNKTHQVILNTGISFPSGDIDQTDNTPAGRKTKLPYPMQLGSGTVDLLPGLTYTGRNQKWSWGFQALSNIRLGRNDNDYSLGNVWVAGGWLAKKITDRLSFSFRLNYKLWEDIDGADPDLNSLQVPTADPDLRGGKRLEALMGFNTIVKDGPFEGNRLAVEFGVPLFQSLQGPQLETDWFLTVGWQWLF